jgi:hypothetical protein
MSDALLPIEAPLADDDDTGNLLAVMTMVDRQFRARRPIGNVSDFVWFVRFPLSTLLTARGQASPCRSFYLDDGDIIGSTSHLVHEFHTAFFRVRFLLVF